MVLPPLRQCLPAAASAVEGDRLQSRGNADHLHRTQRQGPAVRLSHVRPVRAVLHGHVLPDELPQAVAQRSLRRRARQWQLRGRARHALRLGQGLGRLAQHGRAATRSSTCRNRSISRCAKPPPGCASPRRPPKPAKRQQRTLEPWPISTKIRLAVHLPLDPLPGHSSRGRLERVLRRGEFAVTAELNPPDSANPQDVYERAAIFEGWVDGINAVDASGANCHMSSVGICALLTRMGYAPIMQIACRDKNRIAIQGDVLGAAAMGVANMHVPDRRRRAGRRPAGRQAGLRSRLHVAAGNRAHHARQRQVPVRPQADDAAAGLSRRRHQSVRPAL